MLTKLHLIKPFARVKASRTNLHFKGLENFQGQKSRKPIFA